jgi:hypothetical protein
MTLAQMREYDLLLDEDDWDIYYWATQAEEAPSSSPASSSASSSAGAGSQAEAGKEAEGGKEAGGPLKPAKGEWAQTLGTYKVAYRPVLQRWRGSAGGCEEACGR